eukprot:m.283163 g.283163  ORF g.283163 m.283163 type:complete len:627 (+) comp11118_c2_seq8:603-2483(+)
MTPWTSGPPNLDTFQKLQEDFEDKTHEVKEAQLKIERLTTRLKRKPDDASAKAAVTEQQRKLAALQQEATDLKKQLCEQQASLTRAVSEHFPELQGELGALWETDRADFEQGGLVPVTDGSLEEYHIVAEKQGGRVLIADTAEGMRVAIKKYVVHSDKEVKRLKRELRLLARLKHPHIVAIRRLVTCLPQSMFLVELEYYAGGTLAEWLPEYSGAQHAGQKLCFALQVIRACEHMHARGVAHGDIKPDNILLAADHKSIVLTDFDASRDLQPHGATMTTTGQRHTPEYAAPEIKDGGKASAASDVYSLGVLLCEMLAGTRPASADAARAALSASGSSEAQSLAAMVAKMLSPSPSSRPLMAEVSSHGAFSSALQHGAWLAATLATPADWQLQGWDFSQSHAHPPRRHVLDAAATQALEAMINELAAQRFRVFRIVKAERLEHAGLWSKYAHTRDEIAQRLARQQQRQAAQGGELPSTSTSTHFRGSGELVAAAGEAYLFHGTSRAVVDIVAMHGFEERVIAKNGTRYGAGIYFAEDPGLADQYAAKSGEPTRWLVLARVTLGSSHRTTTALGGLVRRAPCIEGETGNCAHARHDSVRAEASHRFREFVVYDRAQTYPEYLIEYRRV